MAALAYAGANIIAVDATARPRPVTQMALLAAIRQSGALAMADCSNLDDATAAHKMGFDIIGTTLSGYTARTTPTEHDYTLIAALVKQLPAATRIMAEGRFHHPEQAARAMTLGAWSVTVGTALTRTEVVTEWFARAVSASPPG